MMLDYSLILSSFPTLLAAVPATLQLFVCVIAIGLIIGIPCGVLITGKPGVLNAALNTYVGAFRGTPALIQLFLIYYGLGQFDVIRHSFFWPVLRDPFWCAVIALSLNSGAYTCRIVAGALSAVPEGMVEGAKALGLSRWHILTRIRAPQAARIAMPAYGNETILNLKATSLASTVTIMDVTGQAKLLVTDTYAPYEIFLSAGVIYFLMTWFLRYVFIYLEHLLDIWTGKKITDKLVKRKIILSSESCKTNK